MRRMPGYAADPCRLHVGGGENGKHARDAARRLGVDRDDARTRMRRTHETAERLVVEARVGDEAAAAAQQRVVLDPQTLCGHPTKARPISPSVPTITRHQTNRPKPCRAT